MIAAILVCLAFMGIGSLVFNKFKLKGLTSFAIASFILLYCYAYFFEASDFGRENQSMMLLLVNAIVYSVPLAIMSFTLTRIGKCSIKIQHAIALVLSVVLGCLFPVFGLLIACGIGSDCL
jgi:uncharacterized iron-regulated membrane protein